MHLSAATELKRLRFYCCGRVSLSLAGGLDSSPGDVLAGGKRNKNMKWIVASRK